MIIVDDIVTNTIGADVLIIQLVQIDVIILKIITGVQEAIIELIFTSHQRRIIITSNTTHDIINDNAVH